MFRKSLKPRENFKDYFEEIGFHYHNVESSDGSPYWREGIAYEFTLKEVEAIEDATTELHGMCMSTVEDIITSGDYPAQFLLSEESKALIQSSWKSPHIYGRFDLAVTSKGDIKLYEYNADTPTSLLEAAVAQWKWVEEVENISNRNQFNSIHEKLIKRWSEVKKEESPVLYLLATKEAHYEDWGNLEYMAETAHQAGWHVHIDSVESVGYDSKYKEFVDPQEYSIQNIFKLYPWEWMMDEEFGQHIVSSKINWFEPAWKMLLSNKAILPILWEKYPEHPNLLPSYFDYAGGDFVRKPLLGREGSNVYRMGQLEQGSHFVDFYDKSYISQSYFPVESFEGYYPVVGSWVVGDEAVGMGIREDNNVVTGNNSHFVPHYFTEN